MSDFDSNILDKDKQDIQEPSMYNVIFHNDDYTPLDFVAAVLKRFFEKEVSEAFAFAEKVHKEGKGIAGIYTYDIASTKTVQTSLAAKAQGHPLKVTIEKI